MFFNGTNHTVPTLGYSPESWLCNFFFSAFSSFSSLELKDNSLNCSETAAPGERGLWASFLITAKKEGRGFRNRNTKDPLCSAQKMIPELSLSESLNPWKYKWRQNPLKYPLNGQQGNSFTHLESSISNCESGFKQNLPATFCYHGNPEPSGLDGDAQMWVMWVMDAIAKIWCWKKEHFPYKNTEFLKQWSQIDRWSDHSGLLVSLTLCPPTGTLWWAWPESSLSSSGIPSAARLCPGTPCTGPWCTRHSDRSASRLQHSRCRWMAENTR